VRTELLSLFLVTAIGACAGSGSSSAPAPASSIMRVSGPAGNHDVVLGGNDPSSVRTLPYAADKVWRALPAVFDSIGFPVAMLDQAQRTIGNEAFKLRKSLKGVPLSRYIDCGSSTSIGPNADSYDVVLTMVAEVHPIDAGTSSTRLTFSAVARPATFSQDYSQCSSKSGLETRFMALLASALAR
jgi:hypothetical protein